MMRRRRSSPSLRLEQRKGIQELLAAAVVMAAPVRPVAIYAQGVGGIGAVEALHAREVRLEHENPAAFADGHPALDDVVERQDFPEVEEAVPVPVKLPEEVRVGQPCVPLLLHQG